MRKLRIGIGKGYDVLIERGLLSHCGKYVRSVSRGTRAMAVSYTHLTLPTISHV